MKHTFIFLSLFIAFQSYAQQPGDLRRTNTTNTNNQNVGKTQSVVETKERPPIDQYKIINSRNDTITADTSLTIHKEYKYNYLRVLFWRFNIMVHPAKLLNNIKKNLYFRTEPGNFNVN